MATTFDRDRGERLKAEGIALVSVYTLGWQAAMFQIVIEHAPWGTDFMAELFYTLPGFIPPPRPGAMGALVSFLVKRRVIVKTGRFGKSERDRNHVHPYAIYRRIDWTAVDYSPPAPRRRRRKEPAWLS